MVEQTPSCISVVGGDFFDLLKPSENDYNIEVIAHALSRINRYTGHVVTEYYSVAEHSVLVSEAIEPKYALVGLLHDSSEAFVGDVASPLKKLLGKTYSDIEDSIQHEIARRYNLPYPFPVEVHEADKRVYWAERRTVAPAKDKLWHQELRSSRKVTPEGWSPDFAKQKFLERYSLLTNTTAKLAA